MHGVRQDRQGEQEEVPWDIVLVHGVRPPGSTAIGAQSDSYDQEPQGTVSNMQILGVTMEVITSIVSNFGVKKINGLELFYRHLNLLSEAAKPLAKSQTV